MPAADRKTSPTQCTLRNPRIDTSVENKSVCGRQEDLTDPIEIPGPSFRSKKKCLRQPAKTSPIQDSQNDVLLTILSKFELYHNFSVFGKFEWAFAIIKATRAIGESSVPRKRVCGGQ